MDQMEISLRKILFKKSFYEFLKYFWNEVEPAPFVDGPLIQFYCETFQYMCRPWIGYEEIDIQLPEITDDINIIDVRENKNKLNINMPPRHSKSLVFNVMAATWIWTYYPLKVASISHIKDLSQKMNESRKKIINSIKYKELYPHIVTDTNKNDKISDSRGGEMYSLNRDAMTGFGADIIINDDLTNAQVARKDKEEMNNAWNYYQNTLPSRINNLDKSIIINIQQRLAPNDITGHIMNDKKLSSEYTFVVLPAIFEKATYIVCPISGDIYFYDVGSYLWPERFGDYSSLRNQVGESVFQTQYLQKPIASDKVVIKEDMITIKDPTEVLGYDISNNRIDLQVVDMVYASHDFPVKDREKSDNLGSLIGYRVGYTLYLVDAMNKRMDYNRGTNYVRNLDNAYPGIIQIIEDKANGSPILQQLQSWIAGLQAFQPGTQSKTQRLESASIYMNSKNVVFVRTKFNSIENKWELSDGLNDLITHLKLFPYLQHDDDVDAFSMMVLYVFMDRGYQVYGRAFNDMNILKELPYYDYSTVFFNKEGDMWKAILVGVQYGVDTKLIVLDETVFRASVDNGIKKLKEFAPDKTIFIDSSYMDSLTGMYDSNTFIERYGIDDFELSVNQLNKEFASNHVLVMTDCRKVIGDIESFKYDKSINDNVKRFKTEKDGFVACLRVALKYYGLS